MRKSMSAPQKNKTPQPTAAEQAAEVQRALRAFAEFAFELWREHKHLPKSKTGV